MAIRRSAGKKKNRLILYGLKYTKKAFTAEFQSRFLMNSTETARTPGPFLSGSQARSSSNLRGSRAGLPFPPLPCRLLTFALCGDCDSGVFDTRCVFGSQVCITGLPESNREWEDFLQLCQISWMRSSWTLPLKIHFRLRSRCKSAYISGSFS